MITADVTAVTHDYDDDDDEIVEEEIIEDSSEDEESYEEELADEDDDDDNSATLPVDPEGVRGASTQSLYAAEMFETSSNAPSTPEKDNNNNKGPGNNHNGSQEGSIGTASADEWGQKWGQDWNRTSSRRVSSSQQEQQQLQREQQPATALAAAGDSADSPPPKVRKIMFPSAYMLFCLGVLIVLITGGIVTGISIYARDNDPLDPLDRPTISPSPNAAPFQPGPSRPIPDFPTPAPSAAPSVQFTTILNLFATVAGDDVYQTGTSANLAANWMILQDPQLVENGGTVPSAFTDQRTEAGWIQRYLLVLLYYATTENRDSEWLSCNPLPDATAETSTACQFTNPTEINGNRILYDIVPSNRWLSAADECNWAGISCITVVDEMTSTTRLAVTSINLGTYGNDANVTVESSSFFVSSNLHFIF
jgi:hypothetical protein